MQITNKAECIEAFKTLTGVGIKATNGGTHGDWLTGCFFGHMHSQTHFFDHDRRLQAGQRRQERPGRRDLQAGAGLR